jgi:hypothetical protein
MLPLTARRRAALGAVASNFALLEHVAESIHGDSSRFSASRATLQPGLKWGMMLIPTLFALI